MHHVPMLKSRTEFFDNTKERESENDVDRELLRAYESKKHA